jgi:hypothetical protein
MVFQNLGIEFFSVYEHEIWLKYIKSLRKRNLVPDSKTSSSRYASALVCSKLFSLIFTNDIIH